MSWFKKKHDDVKEEKRFIDRYQTIQLRKDEWKKTNETESIWLFDNIWNM